MPSVVEESIWWHLLYSVLLPVFGKRDNGDYLKREHSTSIWADFKIYSNSFDVQPISRDWSFWQVSDILRRKVPRHSRRINIMPLVWLGKQ